MWGDTHIPPLVTLSHLGVAQQGQGSMVGQAESLAGLPVLCFCREVVTALLGPQPALRTRPAPGSCKHRDPGESWGDSEALKRGH